MPSDIVMPLFKYAEQLEEVLHTASIYDSENECADNSLSPDDFDPSLKISFSGISTDIFCDIELYGYLLNDDKFLSNTEIDMVLNSSDHLQRWIYPLIKFANILNNTSEYDFRKLSNNVKHYIEDMIEQDDVIEFNILEFEDEDD